VFGLPLRRSFLLLSVAASGAAGPAFAAPDVTDVTLTVSIARSTIGLDQVRAELRVEGTDLNNGTITLPSNPTIQVPFSQDGADLVIEDTFANEAALNASLTNGTYVLRINNGTAQANLSYSRPSVPNPAISQPESTVILPGPLEVLFTRCSVCNLIGDTVEAVLEDDMAAVIDEETLSSISESWIPEDGMGGDLSLPEGAAFVVRVTHSAVRQDNESVAGDDDDGQLLFTHVFVQSDEVDFETGFNPPSGHFCLAANYPTPPAGCATLADPLLQLFDPTGTMVATQVDGHDVDYTIDVGPGGQLSGSASADLDDNGSNETGPAPIKGKLGGGGGEADSKLSFSLENEMLAAKLKVSVTDALSIPGDVQDRVQRASGAVNGVKIKEETSSSDSPLPDPPLGWLLEYDLALDGQVSNAMLTLEGGRAFPLSGANKFNFSSNESSLKLSSDPKGLSITLKKLGLDDAANPDPLLITGGALGYKALGQSGRATLP
jgi:hypothetical protein